MRALGGALGGEGGVDTPSDAPVLVDEVTVRGALNGIEKHRTTTAGKGIHPASVKEGLLFVFDAPPAPDATAPYDDFTAASYEALRATRAADVAGARGGRARPAAGEPVGYVE